MKENVLILASVASMIEQFNMPNIQLLIDKGYNVHVACSFNQGNTISKEKVNELKKNLNEKNVTYHQIDFSRDIFDIRMHIRAYDQVNTIMEMYKFKFIHCHSPIGGVIGRLSAKKNTIRVIYTAHGFHFYKGAPLKNWLVYYPIEKWLSRYTDTLITINKEDYDRAQRKFHAKKNVYIPGVGMNLDKFNNIEYDKKLKRIELGIPEKAFVLLSVGELNKNKNHTTILSAVAKLENPNIHYIICGQGPLHDALVEKSSKLGLTERVHVLGYRSDIAEICNASDVFMFPSLREGLGMAALEGMAMGLPIITSNIHGIVDYSIDGVTGYTCNPDDVECFSRAIERLIKDTNLLKKMSMYNIEAVRKYDINNILPQLKEIYSE